MCNYIEYNKLVKGLYTRPNKVEQEEFMKYVIIGVDRRYSQKEVYGTFDNLRDCLKNMEALKRSFGNIIKFKYIEA